MRISQEKRKNNYRCEIIQQLPLVSWKKPFLLYRYTLVKKEELNNTEKQFKYPHKVPFPSQNKKLRQKNLINQRLCLPVSQTIN